jgi:DNA-binding transcriptional LysR family regulator
MTPRNGIDSHLLRVLATLLEERNVSKTALRLGQTQPAISTALKRLRAITGDELLVRGKNGMVPTEYALSLAAPLRQALATVEQITAGAPVFVARTTRRVFRLASPDYMDPLFLPRLVALLRERAPQSRLELHALNADYDFERALESGALDVAIGNWPQPPESLHLAPLWDDEVAVLLRADHPLARPRALTRAAYLGARHLAPSPYMLARRGLIDDHLDGQGLARDVAVTTPYFNMAPYMLLETDLLFTTSRHFAAHYARLLGLALAAAPIDFPRMRFYALWHARSHDDGACQFLRALLAQAARASACAAPATTAR